jgi:hypothetical protein
MESVERENSFVSHVGFLFQETSSVAALHVEKLRYIEMSETG